MTELAYSTAECDALSVEEIAEIVSAMRGRRINEGNYEGVTVQVESLSSACEGGCSVCFALTVTVNAIFGTEKAYPVYMRRDASAENALRTLIALGRELTEAIEALQGDSVTFLCPPR